MQKVNNKFKYLLLLSICIFLWTPVMAENNAPPPGGASPTLKRAVMCESIQDGLPVNQTIIFDVSNSTAAYCWSEFDPVPADGVIYHEWYRKGELITRMKLAVRSPRWASYSRLPLRQADIGPWHLNIVDENGTVLKTLRFSITE